jgi:hypothetical protein
VNCHVQARKKSMSRLARAYPKMALVVQPLSAKSSSIVCDRGSAQGLTAACADAHSPWQEGDGVFVNYKRY